MDKDLILAQMGLSSGTDILFDEIFEQPIKINGFYIDSSINDCIPRLNKQGEYKKRLIEYAESILWHDASIICDDATELDSADDEMNVLAKYTHGDYWKYLTTFNGRDLKEITKEEKKQIIIEDRGYPNVVNRFLHNIGINSLRKKVERILERYPLDEIMEYCYCEDCDIDNLVIYKEAFKPGHLLYDLYHANDIAVGRIEILILFLYRDSTIQGSNDSFDVLLRNGKTVEVKESDDASFRTGVNGSIVNSDFYHELVDTRNMIKRLFQQLGEERLKEFMTPAFFKLSKDILEEGNIKNQRAISSAISSGEISRGRLDLLELWYFYAHTIVDDFENSAGLVQDVYSKEYKISYGLITEKRELINVLGSLKYVQEPLKFKSDFQSEINGWFAHFDHLVTGNKKRSVFGVFDTPKRLQVEAISQSNFKLIEKNPNKRVDTSKEKAFEEWNEMPYEMDYYEMYKKIKYC